MISRVEKADKLRRSRALRAWNDLPDFMRVPEVRPYYDILEKKAWQLTLKRAFDCALAVVLLILFLIPMLLIALWICLDSKGGPLYRQERVTAYGQHFHIHKFRTMVMDSEKLGAQLTMKDDPRITHAGRILRKLHLDELPQLLDVIEGSMSFVGTRAEVPTYVERYQPEYYATLLMPAGITSEATIRFKNENNMLNVAQDTDETYLKEILPVKMKWNLESIRRFRFLREILTMVRTVLAVLGKEYH